MRLYKCIILFCLVILCIKAGFADQKGTEELITHLFEGNQKQITAALNSIKTYQPSQVPHKLAEKVLSSDKEIRTIAIKALKLYPKKKVLSDWIYVLNHTGSFVLQKKIIDELSDIYDRRLVIPFAEKLKSPYYTVRRSAASALTKGDDRMYPFILQMAESSNPVHKIYAIEAMFYLYDMRFYNSLIYLLKDKNKSVRIYTIRCIKINKLDKALYLLRSIALNDPNDEVRINSIQSIGEFRDVKALYVLHKTLKDNNRDVRYNSVAAVKQIGSKSSAYHLSNQLLVEDDEEIIDLTMETFHTINSIGHLEGLKKVLLTNNNPELRIKAAYTLGHIYNRKNSSVLISGLTDSDYRVRAEICYALGNYKTRSVVTSLLNVISRDKQRYVRTAALYAIKQIDDKKSLVPLFDIFSTEKDAVFREIFRRVIRELMEKHI